jgi:chemotaxis protein methyltransferase CheR
MWMPELTHTSESERSVLPRDRPVAPVDKAAGADPSVRISPKNFSRLARLVTSELGIRMPDSKLSMIQSRLLQRVRALGLPSLDRYCDHLFSDEAGSDEHSHFINAVTTNKTDFFREPQHFRILTETVLPHFGDRRTLFWSAACSSGEEPYTLAMVLSEYAATRPLFDFRILGTDVSTKVLNKAKEGIYSAQAVGPVPPPMRRKYLLRSRDDLPRVRVNPALRKVVSLHQLNLMDADYGVRDMFDVIFCRNVLIYFDRPVQQAVIRKLCRNLIPGGFLFVSHSESLSGLDLPLIPLGSSCFRKQGFAR